MRLFISNRINRDHAASALTVMELLVSVAIMTVIVFGLYAMFSHTQKALRSSVNQVDVFDAGRAASEMITRELEELSAAGVANGINLRVVKTVEPVKQTDLDDRTPLRTNVLQELFFLTSFTNRWNGIGYRVMEAIDGVGTLYRYSTWENVHHLGTNLLASRFDSTGVDPRTGRVSTNLQRVASGIIHMRLSAFDSKGRKLDVTAPLNGFTNYVKALLPANQPPFVNTRATIFFRPDIASARPNQTEFFFMSNSLPSYVELELGVLDPETFKQYQSVRGTGNAAGFLRKRANKVHLFRSRIPIRTAVP